jgi:hypothetical protein
MLRQFSQCAVLSGKFLRAYMLGESSGRRRIDLRWPLLSSDLRLSVGLAPDAELILRLQSPQDHRAEAFGN